MNKAGWASTVGLAAMFRAVPLSLILASFVGFPWLSFVTISAIGDASHINLDISDYLAGG